MPEDSWERPCKVDKFPTLFRRLLQPHEAVELWKQHLAQVVPAELLSSGACTRVVQDVEDTFLALDTKDSWRYAEVVSRVKFNSTLSMLADIVVASMKDSDKHRPAFTGVHLRIEADTLYFYMGDAFNERHHLLRHFKEVIYNFNAENTVYIAAALNKTGEAEIASILGRKVVTKSMVLDQALLASLDSEQLAILDFLVLSKARYFVGYTASSMSYFCKEYRVLQGWPRVSSYLLDIQLDRFQFKEAMTVRAHV